MCACFITAAAVYAVPNVPAAVSATGGGGDMQLGSTTITTGVPVDLGVPTFTVPVA